MTITIWAISLNQLRSARQSWMNIKFNVANIMCSSYAPRKRWNNNTMESRPRIWEIEKKTGGTSTSRGEEAKKNAINVNVECLQCRLSEYVVCECFFYYWMGRVELKMLMMRRAKQNRPTDQATIFRNSRWTLVVRPCWSCCCVEQSWWETIIDGYVILEDFGWMIDNRRQSTNCWSC